MKPFVFQVRSPSVFRACFFALACLIICTVGYASPQPPEAEIVHFCLPLDFEELRVRDSTYAARKQALNLNVGPPRTVRMIYFLPIDRLLRASVVDSMKSTIRQIQTFYGEQMQAYGYGNTSLAIETDALGEPIVHRLNGQHPDSCYLDNTSRNVLDEVGQVFDRDANVYIVVIDNSTNTIGTGDGRYVGGTGGARGKVGGFALVHGGFSFRTAAHELGHAFGLSHDFRDDAYIMSYGGGNRRSLSMCSAGLLAVHTYFNADIPIAEESASDVRDLIDGGSNPTRELVSPRAYTAGSDNAPIRVRVTDSDGIHQVLLLVQTRDSHPAAGSREVKECRRFMGETDVVVQFDYDGVIPSDGNTSLSMPATHLIHVQAVDTNGNVGYMAFSLTQISHTRIATFVHSNQGLIPEVRAVAFSRNGTTLASAGNDSTVKIWNVATQTNIRTLKHNSRVEAVAFSPDGNILASHSHDVILWEYTTGRKIDTLFRTYSGGSVAFSPDGTILAAGSPDNKVRMWEVSTRREIATLVHGQIGPSLHTVAFSPAMTILASGSQDGTIKLWDVETKGHIATLEAHSGSVFSVAFTPDGATLASAGITRDAEGDWDSTIKLWDVAKRQRIATLDEHLGWIRSLAFSPDSTMLASGSYDNTVKLWDVATWRNVGTLGTPNNTTVGGCIGQVHSVAFSPLEAILASGVIVGNCGGYAGSVIPATGEVQFWDVSKYTSTVPPSAGSNADAVLSLDLIPDGGAGNQRDDGVTSGTVSGKDTKIAVEVFASGVKTPLAGLLVRFDFDSSILAFVKAESGTFGFSIPQATGTYFAATEDVNLPASGFLARGEFKTVADVTGREFSVGIEVVTLAESETSSDDIKTTRVISFNAIPPPATFSISLDGDSAAGDQGVTTLDVASGSVVPIQVFGKDIKGANGISARFEYDAAQVGYDGFDPGGVLPNAQVLAVPAANPTTIDISVVSFGGQSTADSGLVGSIRFRTTDAFAGTTLRLVNAELGRGDQREKLTLSDTGVTLRLAVLSPDFNGDGSVDFGDFIAFGMRFGASRGDERYEAKYDLDEDGTIGFGDFLIFGREFGT